MKSLRLSPCFLLLAALSLSSCTDTVVPPDVMGEEEMVSLMQDVYLLEGYFSVESAFMYDTLQPEMQGAYDSLLRKHDLTREDFERNLKWYTTHPEFNERVLQAVVSRLDSLVAQAGR